MSQIHLRLRKSWIRMEQTQRDTVRSLGFKRVNQVVSVPDNESTRGMVRKIAHAVDVLTELPKPGYPWKGVTVEAGKGKPIVKKAAKAKKKKTAKKAEKEAAPAKKKTTKKAAKKTTTKKAATKKKTKTASKKAATKKKTTKKKTTKKKSSKKKS